jgi:hypothetical protein
MHRTLPIALAVAALAAVPATGQAATRYATPSGFGKQCTTALPCPVAEAITGAAQHDEVVVAPGDYTVSDSLNAPNNLDIHGAVGQARPRLMFTHPTHYGLYLGAGTRLRHVEVDGHHNTLSVHSAEADQVIVRGDGDLSSVVAEIQGSTLRNSLVVGTGQQEVAVGNSTNGGINSSVLRNVTAIAPANYGVAIQAHGDNNGGVATIQAHNTIARGGPGGEGLEAYSTNGGMAHVVASSSDFATSTVVNDGSVTNPGEDGNLTAAPLFADPASGDFRERAGSPTIDAGEDDAGNGGADIDGAARQQGRTDIGANELMAPPAPSALGAAGSSGGSRGDGAGSADRVAPRLSGVAFSHRRLSFRVSEKAIVRITLGRRGKARAGRTRTLVRTAKAGRNRIRLAGRLARGSYRVTIQARDAAGNRSARRTLLVRVTR